MKGKFSRVNLVVVAVLTVICIALITGMTLYANSFSHEQVAKRFSDGTRFSQITLFLPESAEFTVDKVMYFRYNLENKLIEKSITPEKEGARLFVDAFSAYKDVTLMSEKRNVSSKATYLGGDYTLFHEEFAAMPVFTADLNHDRVLLSRSAAWHLYGGESLYDFPITLDGKELLISGVYPDYTGKDNETFYGDSAPSALDILSQPDMPITCYELLVVDPVKNFAVDTVKECLDLAEGSYLMIENSKRFSLANLFQTIPHLVAADKPLPTGVNITPDEIAARRAEKVLAILLILLVVFAVYPVLWYIIWIILLLRLVKKLFDRFVIHPIKNKLSYS